MSGFDINAMKAAILKCNENIKIFEAAIQKERDTQEEYRRIVEELQYRAAHPPTVHVVVEYDED
jgi:hypothetical protein